MVLAPPGAEEGIVVVFPGLSIFMSREMLSETRACLIKVSLITGGTTNSIDAYLEGRGGSGAGVDQVASESAYLAKR